MGFLRCEVLYEYKDVKIGNKYIIINNWWKTKWFPHSPYAFINISIGPWLGMMWGQTRSRSISQ